MEHNTQKFRLKLNLFDGIVLVVALLAAALMLWLMLKPAGADRSSADQSTVIRYTVRLQRCEEGLGAVIETGDRLADNIKNYELGRVVAVETAPCELQALDQEQERIVTTVVEGFEDVILTVETACTMTGGNILVDGGYQLRVGGAAHIRGEGYFGSGYISAIEREVQG